MAERISQKKPRKNLLLKIKFCLGLLKINLDRKATTKFKKYEQQQLTQFSDPSLRGYH